MFRSHFFRRYGAFDTICLPLRNTALLAAIAFSISVLVNGAQSKQEAQDYTGSVLKTLAHDEIVQVMAMHKNSEGKEESRKRSINDCW